MKKLILIAILSVFSFVLPAQTFHPSVQESILKSANSSRAMYGIWRLEDFSVNQEATDKLAQAVYDKFSTQDTVTDEDLKSFLNSDEGSVKTVGTQVWEEVRYAKDLNVLYEDISKDFPASGSPILNPLAYRMTSSVVSDSSGRYFAVILTYR